MIMAKEKKDPFDLKAKELYKIVGKKAPLEKGKIYEELGSLAQSLIERGYADLEKK